MSTAFCCLCSKLTFRQRRCIHDENGNVDPVKAAEAPVPRGSASKRRRVEEDDGEALTKKIKMESFAGLVDGEVSQWNRYPLQKPRPASVSGSREVMVTDPALLGGWASPDNGDNGGAMPIDPRLSDLNGECAIIETSPVQSRTRETVVTSIEHTAAEPMEGVVVQSVPADSHARNPDPCTPEPQDESPLPEQNGFPTASPPRTSSAKRAATARRSSMSPNWSRPAKGTSRSGITKTATPKATPKTATPKTTPGGKGRRDSKEHVRAEQKSEQKPRASSSSTGEKNEDMASIALALKLQMEEHGLRRRSK